MAFYIEGILKLANLFLALVAAAIGIGLFRSSFKDRILRAWKPLAVALVLFAVQQILGALRAFGIYESAYLTHVNVSVLLGFLIYALILQINVTRLNR